MYRIRNLLAASMFASALLSTPGAAQSVTEYGCKVNPSGSLKVASGSPKIGTPFSLSIHNPLKTQTTAFTALWIDDKPDPAYPCGTKLPGWGMSGPNAFGELLVSPGNGILEIVGGTWTGKPVIYSTRVPPSMDFIGVDIYVQGVLADLNSKVQLGLTNGLRINVGPNPTAMPFGKSASGHINPKTEIDVYEFTADAGDHLVIPYVSKTSWFSIQLDLYGPNGKRVTGTKGSSGVFSATTLVSGKHRLSVRSASNSTGYYDLTIQRTKNPGVTRKVTIGSSISEGLIAARTDIDVFQIDANRGDQLVIPMVSKTSWFSMRAELYDANGKLIDAKNTGNGRFVPKPIPATGTYYIWISNPSRNTTGYYDITFQRTAASGNVAKVGIGTSIASARIGGTRTEIDVYELDALAGDSLFVPMVSKTSWFGLYAELYDANGKLLYARGGNGVFAKTVTTAGRYYLWISCSGRNTTGYYDITFQRTRAPGNVKKITVNTGVRRGDINPRTEVEVYEFVALANKTIRVPFWSRTSWFAPEYTLRNKATGKERTKKGGSSGTLVWPVSTTGTYQLWVRCPSLNTTGYHDFDLQMR